VDIEAAEDELRRAMLSGDVAALDRLLDDALMFVAVDGSVASKADDLLMHRSGRMRITKLEPSDRRIGEHGDIALVTVKMDASAIIDGATVNNVLRYTRVWSKKSGAWRIIGGHLSVVA
jgi:ketosteroid isomerase-like protein